nr:hypothetical protein Itr_chr13CG13790 [Ipomoea trifida]
MTTTSAERSYEEEQQQSKTGVAWRKRGSSDVAGKPTSPPSFFLFAARLPHRDVAHRHPEA